MLTAILAFLAGVVLAPVIRPLLRPLLVELIRVGVMTADEVRRLSSEVRENVEDATAEAQAKRQSRAAAADHAPTAPPDPPASA
jgi:hypothetical protein